MGKCLNGCKAHAEQGFIRLGCYGLVLSNGILIKELVMKQWWMCGLLLVALPSIAKMNEDMLCQMVGELAESSLQQREQGVSQDDALQSVYQRTERIEQPFVRGLVNGLMAEVVSDAYQQQSPAQDAFGNTVPQSEASLAAVVENKCKRSGLGAFLR